MTTHSGRVAAATARTLAARAYAYRTLGWATAVSLGRLLLLHVPLAERGERVVVELDHHRGELRA